MDYLLSVLIGLAALFGYEAEPEPLAVGGFGDTFLSEQVGTSPVTGYYLQTDGTNSSWQPVVGGVGGGSGTWSTTTSSHSGRLINYPNNTTDVVTIGGNSTTSSATEFYYDPNTKELLIQSASSTISGPLRVSGTLTVGTLSGAVSASSGVLSAGTLSVANGGTGVSSFTANSLLYSNSAGTGLAFAASSSLSIGGNAGTATALAANGADCSAGSFPLGVDASGAAESCAEAWTEAENTSADYQTVAEVTAFIHGSSTIPKTYTANTFTGLAAFTNTGTTSFTGGLSASRLNTTASSTFAGLVVGTGGLQVPTIPNCNTVDTDASGNFICGSDASGAGGGGSGSVGTSTIEVAGQVPFFSTNGATPALISGDTDLTFSGATLSATYASTTALSVSHFNGLTIDNWTVSTSTTVCAQGCEFTSIQTAVTAGHTDILVKNGTYSETVDVIKDKTKIRGESLNAIIQCNGVTQSPCVDSGEFDEFELSGISVRETNATLNGIGVDISNSALSKIIGNRISNFATSTLLSDTSSNTFYNTIRENTLFSPKTCFELSGTQANANWIRDNRCRPMGVDGGYGAYIQDARGITLSGDFEGTTTARSNIGIYIATSSREIVLENPWVEAMGTGLDVAIGAARVSVLGGSFTSHGTDITASTLTNSQVVFINSSDTGVTRNLLGSATSTGLAVTNLLSCDSIDTTSSGDFICGSDAQGAGGNHNEFTPSTNFGQTVSGTSTALWLQGSPISLMASNTAQFDRATSTLLTATTAWFTNLFIGLDTLAEYISDTAGAMFTGNTETDITITYDDTDNTIDAVVDTLPNLTGTLDVDSGGTGAATFTAGSLLYGAGTGALQVVATSTATIGNGLSYSGTMGSFVGGAAGTLTATLGTTIAPAELVGQANLKSDLLIAVSSDGTGFTATGTPQLTIGNLLATSTTATSTIQGGFLANLLGGNFGIGTSSPSRKLSVQGDFYSSATSTVTGLNVVPSGTVGTSTIYMYSKTAGFGGQIILEDSDAAGCTAVSALNGVLTASIVTCPAEN